MRILQVSSFMPPHLGGIELVAQRLFDGYRAHGHDVEWVSSRIPRDAPAHEDDGRIRVGTLNVIEDTFGVPVPIWSPGGLRQLARAVARAEVVHIHDALYLGNAAAVRFARRMRRPVLLTQHIGLVPYRSRALGVVQEAGWRSLGRAVLDRVDDLVAATPAAETFLRERCPGRAVHAIPNGVDLERFRAVDTQVRSTTRTDLGLDPERPIMLFVGRLVEKKGVSVVLDAARRWPEAQWVVVGDGPLRGLVQAAPVRWVGQVAPEEIHRWYAAADAFVLPSVGEGLPLSVQEAMASGLPCVVTVGEAYVGPMVRAEAVVALERGADLSLVLRDSRPNWSEVGARARSYAEAHWSAEACIEAHLDRLGALL